MNMSDQQQLSAHGLRGELRNDEPMARHVSWRAGGPVRRAYTPADLDDMALFLRGLPDGEGPASDRRVRRSSRPVASGRGVRAPRTGERPRHAARAEGAALVPFLLTGVADVPNADDLFQADRIHPKAEAHPRMLANVWPALRPLLK